MSLFDLFKPKKRQLKIGETDGEYIGCYLFGIEGDDSSPPSYHSLATTRDDLVKDCREFFEDFAERKAELVKSSRFGAMHEQDLKVIVNATNNLEVFMDMHFKHGGDEPFLNVAGLQIFLRTGARKREKLNGKYIE